MANCLSIDDFRIVKLSQDLGMHPALVSAKVAVWQENNGNTNNFPKAEDLINKQLVDNNSLIDGDIVYDKNNTKFIFRGFRKANQTGEGSPRLERTDGTNEIAIPGKNIELFKAKDLVGKAINIYHSGKTGVDNKSLSNLFERPFIHNEKKYFSVEHAYQSLKSGKFDLITYNKYKGGGVKIGGNLGTKTDNNYNIILMKQLIKESFEQNPSAKEELLNTRNSQLTHTQDNTIWKTKFPELLMEVRNELRGKTIVQTTQSTADKLIQSKIVDEYFFYKNASDTLSNIQGLLQLIKGFKGTFAEAENFITLLNKLGYSINDDFTDIVKNDMKTDKFAKNYEKTKSTITTRLKEAGVLHPHGYGINVVLNDKFLRQSIITAIDLMKVSKSFFVSQTSLAKSIRDNVSSLFKPFKASKTTFKNNFRKNFLSYLTVTAYINSVKNNEDLKIPHIKDFLLTPLDEVAEGKEYNNLQSKYFQILSYNRENGIKNDFLDFLQPSKVDYDKHSSSLLYNYRLNLMEMDSRNVKDPDKIQSLISGFNQLYFANNDNIIEKNEEVKRINNLKYEFARDMFKYLIVKDGLLYQNQSFIKAIDPILFLETSYKLDEIQELFKKENPSSSEFTKLFGMTKEELELDFVLKFSLHANNYFDLKSQKLGVILTEKKDRDALISKQKEEEKQADFAETDKIENAEYGDEENIDEELVQEDNYPLYWHNVDKSLTVNLFAGQTTNMLPQKKKQNKAENRRYILSKENEIFKKIREPFETPDGQIKHYDVIGLPVTTYVNDKKGNTADRIPLKLTIVQNTVEINKQFITLQFSPEGKVIRTDKKNFDKLSSLGVMFTDLQENSIFEIINNPSSLKLKTSKDNIPNLIKIAKELSNFYRGGYIIGTKAKYEKTIILGSSKLSSFGDDLQSQMDIKMSEEEQKKVTLSMYNRKDKTIKDEDKRDILIAEINKYSTNTITKESAKNIGTPNLEEALKRFIRASSSNLTEKQIEDKIKECFKTK